MAEIRNADTRERILDAAERLFMAYGYDGTSMRQITGEAGVNLAAVNYHFGSKEALIQEVFRRRLDWLNEERMRVLDRHEADFAANPRTALMAKNLAKIPPAERVAIGERARQMLEKLDDL